ncbi:helix-turn-helix transcriptional regulator [Bacillus sp. REN10]|uniref:helix-turn-helix domain-containing protein n=1 Tax=Bacillus sp. REN10 TaxID=2782541 RepID=UPI00193C094C|nr:helix-turn-helix transcriptional regulator [Bacillus sp. REN10]
MNIGKRIIQLREKKGWSQRELARRVNLNVSVMNRIESGDRPIKDHELAVLSDVLDVNADYLLGRTNNPETENTVTVAGQEVSLSPDELRVFEELKKHPIMFHDLATDPEKKVKELIKLYKMKKIFFEDDDDEEYGDGFGDFED